ncbi:hypothetical protein Trydic_g15827 [Trypoxylus dichotomus]
MTIISQNRSIQARNGGRKAKEILRKPILDCLRGKCWSRVEKHFRRDWKGILLADFITYYHSLLDEVSYCTTRRRRSSMVTPDVAWRKLVGNAEKQLIIYLHGLLREKLEGEYFLTSDQVEIFVFN